MVHVYRKPAGSVVTPTVEISGNWKILIT